MVGAGERGAAAGAVAPLFVPGDRPDRFAKAYAAGADIVILDLEDAVAPAAKPAALDAVAAELAQPGPPVAVRLDGDRLGAQIDRLSSAGPRLAAVMIPKAERAEQIEAVHDRLGIPVIALVETAAGIAALAALAQARGILRFGFGALDFALDIDAEVGGAVLDYPRAALVVASRAAGLPAPLDSPSPEIRDLTQVALAAGRARAFGFGGQLCIHPAQLGEVRHAFRPSDAELEWARRVLAAQEGAAQVDGAMVDRPVVDRARRLLDRAQEAASQPGETSAGDLP